MLYYNVAHHARGTEVKQPSYDGEEFSVEEIEQTQESGRTSSKMKLFTQPRKMLSTVLGTTLISMMIVACGNSPATSTTPPAPTNGKNCTKIGVLLPETASSARWDSKDKPLLTSKIKAAVPGATVDYANAGG